MHLLRGDRVLTAVCLGMLSRTDLLERRCFGLLFRTNCTYYTDQVCYLHRLVCYGTVGERTEVLFYNFFLVEMACFC